MSRINCIKDKKAFQKINPSTMNININKRIKISFHIWWAFFNSINWNATNIIFVNAKNRIKNIADFLWIKKVADKVRPKSEIQQMVILCKESFIE